MLNLQLRRDTPDDIADPARDLRHPYRDAGLCQCRIAGAILIGNRRFRGWFSGEGGWHRHSRSYRPSNRQSARACVPLETDISISQILKTTNPKRITLCAKFYSY